jgi:lipopolysaccharide export system protein LptA
MKIGAPDRFIFAAVAVIALAAAPAAAQTGPRLQSTSPDTKRDVAAAQPAQGPPNALQGFSQNRDQPVHIESATLEVRDKQKIATFSGNVHLIQGDTDMRCKTLMVFYEDDSAQPGVKAAQPGPGGQQQIKRLEAKGGVVVTQKDQTATGQNGIFDMKANTVTLLGNVVMSQGQNVLMGERLVVNLATGVSVVDDGKGGQGGRVKGLFHQGQSSSGAPAAGPLGVLATPPTTAAKPSTPPAAGTTGALPPPPSPATTTARDTRKPAPGQPLRLN